MTGNVREWTNDWYDGNYYPFMPKQNPRGPETGRYRSVRGSGWLDVPPNAIGGPTDVNTVDSRDFSDPELRATTIGFRCAK
jgi:formylglycine-generating enzyme required for sulfatase activity